MLTGAICLLPYLPLKVRARSLKVIALPRNKCVPSGSTASLHSETAEEGRQSCTCLAHSHFYMSKVKGTARVFVSSAVDSRNRK